MQTDLTSLSVAELKIYAQDELGISFPSKITKAELVARIRDYEGEDVAESAGHSSANEGNEDKVPTHAIIKLPEDEDSQNYVKVNVNGRRYQLMKGKNIKVPYVVYDVLNNAVEGVPVKVKGDDGRERVVMRTRMRFPVSLVELIY